MKIPRATRLSMESGVVAPQRGPQLGAVRQGLSQLGQGISAVGDVMQDIKNREDVASAAEFDANVMMQFSDRYNEAKQNPEIMDDPSKMREAVNGIHKGILESEEYNAQSAGVKRIIKGKLFGYRKKFLAEGLTWEAQRRVINTGSMMDSTLERYELQALDSNDGLVDLMTGFTVGVKALAESGAIDMDQAEQHLKTGNKSILMNRAQKYLNEGDMKAVETMMKDEEYREILGAEGIQQLKGAVARKVSLRQDQRDKMESIRQSKPYEYLAKSGAPDAPEISFTDMGRLSDTIDNRMKYTQDMNEIYGTRAPVLRPVEVVQFTSMVDGSKPAAASAQLRALASNMTDKQLDAIAGQLYETRPDIGMALSYSEFDPKFSESLLNGAKVRADKVVKLPEDEKIKNAVNEVIGEAVRTPAHRKAIQQAVINAYADGVFKGTYDEGSSVDSSDIKDMLKTNVLGELISAGKGTTIGFRKEDGQFITDSEFDGAYKTMSENQLILTHGSAIYDGKGNRVNFEDTLKNSVLVAVGDGVYRVRVNGFDFQNSAGQPFKINMKKIYKSYKTKPTLKKISEKDPTKSYAQRVDELKKEFKKWEDDLGEMNK